MLRSNECYEVTNAHWANLFEECFANVFDGFNYAVGILLFYAISMKHLFMKINED